MGTSLQWPIPFLNKPLHAKTEADKDVKSFGEGRVEPNIDPRGFPSASACFA